MQAPPPVKPAQPTVEAAGTYAARVRGLVKRYGNKTAVDGIDLDVVRGECFGVLGPNGAGKTTTLEVLTGLREADAGDVEVLGMGFGRGHDREIRSRIGVQFQETTLSDKLTVGELVALFADLYPRSRSVAEVLASLDLERKKTSRAGELSGGERQRLALACALVSEPELLFLDEPSTGLDPRARGQLWETIRNFRARGGTIILTTHSMEEAAALCDRLAIVDRGKVIALGSPAQLIARLGAPEVIEIEVEREPDLTALRGLGGMRSVEMRGDRLRLCVGELRQALPTILAELDRQGIGSRSLVTHRATLDDVFLQLTGKGLEDE